MKTTMFKKLSLGLASLFLSTQIFASGGLMHLDSANNDVHNEKSLQNGAKLYFNYCSGCHSIEYMRYQRISDDLNIEPKLVEENFIFTNQKIKQLVKSSISKHNAVGWFGANPPDLSLTARSRGVDWIYSYLRGFYPDDSSQFGVNNHILVGTSMPDVLANKKASMSEADFNSEIRDLTNFLDYVSEPIQLQRGQIGKNVLIFLAILLLLSFLLKKEYWQDVKYGHWRVKD